MSPLPAAPLRHACSLGTALFVLTCSADTSRGPTALTAPTAPALSARVALPFTGTRKTMQTAFTPLGPTTVLLNAYGMGTATHLGRYTEVSDLNADGLSVNVVEYATITGGTGRFAGAAGSYTIRCLANQATGLSTGSFEGTIILAG